MQPDSNTPLKKTIYFVRHGESADNVAPVFQAPDSPLSPKGREQADHIAKRVSGLSFDALIASPLQRAKTTAEIIAAATGKTPEFSDIFVECAKPAVLNGKPYEDSEANALWRQWQESLRTPGMRADDGENFDDIIERADTALELLKNREEQSIVVVTHGYFLRTIVTRVLLGDTLTPETFGNFQKLMFMENTGLSVLLYEGAFEQDPCWRLWVYNDHAHLAD